MSKKSNYQSRKAAGLCVWAGCGRKPKLGKDGTPRSYCRYHNAPKILQQLLFKGLRNLPDPPHPTGNGTGTMSVLCAE